MYIVVVYTLYIEWVLREYRREEKSIYIDYIYRGRERERERSSMCSIGNVAFGIYIVEYAFLRENAHFLPKTPTFPMEILG